MATTNTTAKQTYTAAEAMKNKLKNASALSLPVLSFLASFALPGMAGAVDPNATPGGENVLSGGIVTERPHDGRLNIHQSTNRALIEWDTFDIGSNAWTQFYQPNSSSVAVNRVVGAGNDPTQILGTLKANGNVMVLDRNGVFFGKDARIDVGGIVASTGNINDEKFVTTGQVQLSDFGDGAIVNQGMISVADGGLAAFVAPTVVNNGIITARMGRVELAAGNTQATVDLYGDGLVEFAVTDDAKRAVVENSGVIDAEGGVIAMTTGGAKAVVDSVINMSGVATAKSATVSGGKIVLGGGEGTTVTVSGNVDASGATGGGTIAITGDDIDVAAGSSIAARATDSGAGGEIVIIAENSAFFGGSIDASSEAQGGFVETSGYNEVDFGDDFSINVNNGGHWLIDPQNININAALAGNIATTLDANSNVTVNTSAAPYGGAGAAAGNINVDSDITWSGLGSLTMLADNNINLNRLITSHYAGGNSNRGAVTLVAANNINNNSGGNVSGIVTDAGHITLQAGNNITLAGNGGQVTKLFSEKGNISLSAIRDITLGGEAGAAGNFTRIDSNNGNVSLTADRDINITAGDETDSRTRVVANAGTMTLAAGRNLTLTGKTASNADATVVGNGGITATAATGAVTLHTNSELRSNGGNVTVGGASVTLNDGSRVSGSDVTINATGGNIAQGANAIINAMLLKGSATGSAIMTGIANTIGALGGFTTGGNFALNDSAGGLAVVGDVTATGDVDVTTVGDLTVAGNGGNAVEVKSTGGNINLTGTNVIVGSTAGANNGTKLTAGDTILLTGNDVTIQSGSDSSSKTEINAGNIFGTLANNNTTISAGAAGNTTIDAAIIGLNGDFDVSGAGDVIINDGVEIETSNNTYISGANIALNGGSIKAIGVGLTAAGSIIQQWDSKIDTGILAGSSGNNTLLNGANEIGLLGNFTVADGGFSLMDADGIDITGNVTTTNGDVTVNTTGNVNVLGNITANGAAGYGVDLVAQGAGNITQYAGSTITSGDDVYLQAGGAISQEAGSKIVTNVLRGIAGTSVTLTSATNEIARLGNLRANNGNLAVNDSAGGLIVEGIVRSTNGNIDIDTVGNFALTSGEVNANGGHIDIDQTGSFAALADSIKTTGTGTISLWQRVGGSVANAVAAFLNTGSGQNTLDVDAGTYNETTSVVMDQRNFQLRGAQAGTDARLESGVRTAGSVDESIINFGGGVRQVLIAADNVTIDGFEITNATGTSNDLIYANTKPGAANERWTGIVVKNNIIHNGRDEGIQLRDVDGAIIERNNIFNMTGDGINIADGSKDSFIQDNEIYDTHSTNGQIYVYNSDNITIQRNYLHDITGNDAIKLGNDGFNDTNRFVGNVLNNRITGTYQDGIAVYSSGALISGNDISGSQSTNGAIHVQSTNANLPTGVVIENNIIHDNATRGIRVSKANNLTIRNNTFSNNTGAHVEIRAGQNAAQVTVTGNSFGTSGGFAVTNLGTGTLNADANWWNTTTDTGVQGRTSGLVDFSTYLGLGTDTDVVTKGFQGDYSDLFVTLLGAQTGASGRVAEGLAFLTDGSLTGAARTLHVMAGNYGESLVVNKSANILGFQADIAAAGRSGAEASLKDVTITADNVQFNGFTVDGAAVNGVFVDNADNVAVRNNIITGSAVSGIQVNGSDNTDVLGNAITGGTDSGVRLDNSTNAEVNGNTISGVTGIGDGIRAFTSYNLTANNNILSNLSGSGIGLAGSDSFYGEGNTITNASRGFWVGNSDDAEIVDNDITGSGTYGIFLTNYFGSSDHAVIKNNRISGGQYGIFIEGGATGANIGGAGLTDGNTIESATISGLHISNDSTVATFLNNKFKNNAQHITYLNGAGADLIADSASGNLFWTGTDYELTGDMSVAELFALEDLITHKMDNASNGLVVFNNGELYVTSNTGGIQHAIDILGANGTVNVDGGTYTENLMLDFDGLKLTGHGTTLQYDFTNSGRGVAGNLITVIADNVNIDPFVFDGMGASYGVNANGADNLVVDGNEFLNFSVNAINLVNSDNALITGNNIHDIGQFAIFADSSDNATIRGNTIDNANVGVLVVKSNGSIIGGALAGQGNTITNVADGIAIRADGVTADGHLVQGNTIDGTTRTGMYFDNVTNTTIGDTFATTTGGNIVRNTGRWAAIYALNGSNLQVRGNDIDHADEVGIRLENVGGAFNIIDNNDVDFTGENKYSSDGSNSGDGIQAINVAGLVAVNNDIGTNGGSIGGNGLYVTGSNGATVSSNDVSKATGNGILVRNSNTLTMGTNVISETGLNGIDIAGSNDAIVDRNTISKTTGAGIKLNGGANNKFTKNTLTQIGQQGFVINGATSNLLVDDNTLTTIGWSAIQMDSGSNATFSNNEITKAGGDGMRISGTQTVSVTGNTIDDVTINGITVNGTANASVTNNVIKNADAVGIRGNGGNRYRIEGNDIDGVLGHGIYLSNATGAFNIVNYNDVDTAGDDGIRVLNASNLVVAGNDIGLNAANAIGGNGIYVENATDGVDVLSNRITDAALNGIIVKNSDDAVIQTNIIASPGQSGILLEDSDRALIGGTSAGYQNVINGTDGGWPNAGIRVKGGVDNIVRFNTVNNAGSYGIVSDSTGSIDILNNTINGAAWSGIQFYHSNDAVINDNKVYGAQTGISGETSTGVDIKRNVIGTNAARMGGNGIELFYGVHDSVLAGNTIYATNNGITLLNTGGQFNDRTTIGGAGADRNTINGGLNGIVIDGGDSQKVLNNAINTVSGDGINVTDLTDIAGANRIEGNEITGAGGDGIDITNSGGTQVKANILKQVANYGILVNGGASALTIDGNQILGTDATASANGIAGAGLDGIHVDNNANVQITGNTVKGGNNTGGTAAFNNRTGGAGAGQNGIYISNSVGADVTGNHILAGNSHSTNATRKGGAGAGANGIFAENNYALIGDGDGVTISNNEIKSGSGNSPALGSGQDGIRVINSGARGAGVQAIVHNNTITRTGGDGIHVEDTNGITISKNTIDRTGNDGIDVSGSDDVVIGSTVAADGNIITRAGEYGVVLTGGLRGDVLNNSITTAALDGILVDGNDDVIVAGNKTTGTTGNGIQVTGSSNAVIGGAAAADGNIVKTANLNGILLNGGTNGIVQHNTIQGGTLLEAGAKLDGIHVASNAGVQVLDNHVLGGAGLNVGAGSVGGANGANGHGIAVTDSADAYIARNEIKGADGFPVDFVIPFLNIPVHLDIPGSLGALGDGIYVANSNGADVDGNTVKFTGGNGISLIDSSNVTANANTVSNTGGHGIFADPAFNVSITGNTVFNTILDGIHAEDIVVLDISGNTVTAAGQDGIGIERSALVNVSGNTVTGSVSGHGISLNDTAGSLVSDNDVTGTILGNGIDVRNSTGSAIVFNRSLGALGLGGANTGDGIYASNVTGLAIIGNISGLNRDDAIDVDASSGVVIALNAAGATLEGHGIEVSDTDDVIIALNLVGLTGNDGINVQRSNGALIQANLVVQTGGDGIEAIDNANAVIRDNIVLNAGEDGIAVSGALATQNLIDNNTVTTANRGIVVNAGATGADITDNTVDGTIAEGILSDGDQDTISGNTISNAGAYGIHAANDAAGGLIIHANIIDTTTGGINVTDVADASITDNILTTIDGDGIAVSGAGSTQALIDGNSVITATRGIVVNSGATGADITGNTVDGTIAEGILSDGDQDTISGNTVSNTGAFAIDASNDTAGGLDIKSNIINNTAGGIKSTGVDHVEIALNQLTDINGNGIEVAGGMSADLILNQLKNIIDAVGIKVSDNRDAAIADNTLTNDAGISSVAGIEVNNSNGAVIGTNLSRGYGANTIDTGTEAAIRVNGGDSVFVTDNVITDSDNADDLADYGVEMNNATNSAVTGVNVTNRKTGIYVNGGSNNTANFNTVQGNVTGIHFNDVNGGSISHQITPITGGTTGIIVSGNSTGIVLTNNRVDNNGTGILINVNNLGSVQLTDNQLTGNTTGLQLEGGLIDLTSLTNPNTITGGSVGLRMAPPAGLEDQLQLVGNTLGATRFVDQNDFFIRLEDGAYFVGGTPFVIDALNVSFTKGAYSNFIPANSPYGPGILTLAQLQFLEGYIFDLDDLTGRGQIFTGTVPGLDESDLFPNGLGTFGTPGAGFQLTILGLPTVPGAASQSSLGAFLNNITPFAGGDDSSPETLAGIAPAAGGNVSELNAIAPAGGETASCWADVGAAVGVSAVNYSFSNSSADAMDAAAACGG